MESLLKADIFFFIAAIGYSISFLMLFVVLFYLIKAFKNVQRITKKIEENVDDMSDSARAFIEDLRESMVFQFIFVAKKKRKSVQNRRTEV